MRYDLFFDARKAVKGVNLWEGDCLDRMKAIQDNEVDLILTDLPYGTTNCSWDSPIDLSLAWREWKRVLKEDGVVLLFAQTPFDKVLGLSNIKDLRYEWVWEKTQATGHLNSKRAPMKAHENILVFYSKKPKYYPQKTKGHTRKVSSAENRKRCIERRNDTDNIYNNEMPDKVKGYDSTERFPRSVLKYPSDKQKTALHKTQKPVALLEYLVKTYTDKGELVLDATMGSASTAVACINLERRFVGIEKDSKMFLKAKNRIDTLLQERLI